MATTINLHGELLPHTMLGLMLVVEKHPGWEGIDFYAMSTVDLVYFSEQLKEVDDTEEFFPAGKWATIQRLQQIIQKNK